MLANKDATREGATKRQASPAAKLASSPTISRSISIFGSQNLGTVSTPLPARSQTPFPLAPAQRFPTTQSPFQTIQRAYTSMKPKLAANLTTPPTVSGAVTSGSFLIGTPSSSPAIKTARVLSRTLETSSPSLSSNVSRLAPETKVATVTSKPARDITTVAGSMLLPLGAKSPKLDYGRGSFTVPRVTVEAPSSILGATQSMSAMPTHRSFLPVAPMTARTVSYASIATASTPVPTSVVTLVDATATHTSAHASFENLAVETSPTLIGGSISAMPAKVLAGSLPVPSEGAMIVSKSAVPLVASCQTLQTVEPAIVDDGPVGDPFLQAGAMVQIQGVFYRIGEPLGMGSFGAVWGAERCDETGGSVAIKEILCRSSKDLADATLESRLLSMIHDAKPEENQLAGKVPDLVGKEAQSIGPDQWMMRLAMTKVQGMQLDTFLEMCNSPTLQGSNIDHAAAVAIATQCCSLSGACGFARTLLSQLAAIFDRMSSVVYHRDVSPHNVLIDASDPKNPRFGLVDFGLGIDVQSWIGPKSHCSWHHVDIGGDCRYWPISVWIMFVDGSSELDKTPVLSREYQERLDFHAVGITVLEILMQLLPYTALDAETVQPLRAAWTSYWQDVHGFWKRTMEVFDSGEDPSEFKRWIKAEGQVVHKLGVRLSAIRGALRQASSRSAKTDASRLFLALLQLISNGGYDPVQTPRWADIRGLIDSDDTTARTPIRNAAGSMLLPSKATFSSACGGSMLVPLTSHLQGSMLLPAGIAHGSRCRSPVTSISRRPGTPLASTYAAVRIGTAR